jgi:hypothetical protein
MKSLKLLVALLFAGALTLSVAQAGEGKGECKDKPAEKCCECGVDKDGKECGKDKECCCAAKKDKKDCEDKKDCDKPKG